jgi:DNA-binding response OmpR family regulator
MKPKILFVEDEDVLGPLVKEALERKNFEVTLIKDSNAALAIIEQQRFDICVLDVMLPGVDGFAIAKQIRAADNQTPILFLTAKSQTSDILKGFEVGGNDYVKKPFSIDELIARIYELIRRYGAGPGDAANKKDNFKIGSYLFYPGKQLLVRKNNAVVLSFKEAELLRELVILKNEVVEKRTILIKLWGQDNFFNGRNMDVYIVKLRKLLKEDNDVSIVNVRGIGYKLVDIS